jgi:toxin ParE1/3/4
VKPKPVVLREQAMRDLDEALAYYIDRGAGQAASRFIDAVEQAFTLLGRHPATGSPRYAHALNLPQLRSWPLRGYPYLVFYVEREGHVDVWRALHCERDIPAWLRKADPG